MTATKTRGLPAIEPYPMPTVADLPTNRVDWTLDAGRAVLLVHDMQNYFLRAFTPGTSPRNTSSIEQNNFMPRFFAAGITASSTS